MALAAGEAEARCRRYRSPAPPRELLGTTKEVLGSTKEVLGTTKEVLGSPRHYQELPRIT